MILLKTVLFLEYSFNFVYINVNYIKFNMRKYVKKIHVYKYFKYFDDLFYIDFFLLFDIYEKPYMFKRLSQ